MFSQALSVPHSTNRGSLDSRFWPTLLFIALFFEIVALILPQAQAFRQFIFFTNFQRPFSGNQAYCMISPACKAHTPRSGKTYGRKKWKPLLSAFKTQAKDFYKQCARN
jgi:hypothetical protein